MTRTGSDDRTLSLLAFLRKTGLCSGLGDGEIRYLADRLSPHAVPAGEVVCRQGDVGRSMYIVERGRLLATAVRPGEGQRLLESIGRGGHFGELALLGDGIRTATVAAAIDSHLLELELDRFNEALVALPRFAANLSRTLVSRLRAEGARRARRHRPAVVAIVDAARPRSTFAPSLMQALVDRGERLNALTDRAEKWSTDPAEHLVERIPTSLAGGRLAEAVRARVLQMVEHQQRVILDLDATSAADDLIETLQACEQIFWVCDARSPELGCQTLTAALAAAPQLASRIHLTWLLGGPREIAPNCPMAETIAELQFKVVHGGSRDSWDVRQSLERVVRHLRGVRIGLALSGGGARGLAHLGAIRALEREGIGFDLVAGASSGALMGLSYCAGWRPDEALVEFREALTPRRIVRALPGGTRWRLWSMFRSGAWDGMLRRYLPNAGLEQLLLPLSAVTVDLSTGVQVVRDRGDAVRAIVESINLPFASRPLMHDGMALVDGGVLNNLPGDALLARGADLVIAVDVSLELAPFPGGVRGRKSRKMKRPGLLETLLRVSDVQARAMVSMRSEAIDLTIAPNCAKFGFADFHRAAELGDVGDVAAQAALPRLKEMIAERELAASWERS